MISSTHFRAFKLQNNCNYSFKTKFSDIFVDENFFVWVGTVSLAMSVNKMFRVICC